MSRILRKSLAPPRHSTLSHIKEEPSTGEIKLTAQTDAANEPHVHHAPVAETRGAEIHPHGRRRHQVSPAALVRQEAEHQVLEEAARVRERDVGASGGVGGLLEEDGVAGYFADVDGDGEALAWLLLGEGGVSAWVCFDRG